MVKKLWVNKAKYKRYRHNIRKFKKDNDWYLGWRKKHKKTRYDW